MDGLEFYVPSTVFQSFRDDGRVNMKLSEMKRRLGSGRISPPAGFKPATPWSEVGSANRSATRTLLCRDLSRDVGMTLPKKSPRNVATVSGSVCRKVENTAIPWPLGAMIHITEPPHDKTSKMAYAPSEDSDQPGHPPSLIRVFAVCMKKAWVLSYPLSAQRILIRLGWSESSLGAKSFCWFCHEAAQFMFFFCLF